MRHVHTACQNGTAYGIQVLLFMLLQVSHGNGRIIYHRMDKRTPFVHRTLHPTQKDKETTSPSNHPSTDLMPHVKALGFFPRGDVIHTPDDVRHLLPQIMNQSRAKQIDNAKIWREFVSRALELNSTIANRQRVATASPQHNSSQIGIPHLERLGFGLAKNQPGVGDKLNSNGDIRNTADPHIGSELHDNPMKDLHRTIVLGIGSFLGGMLVILIILFMVFLRRRWLIRQHQPLQTSRLDVENKPDDPKLCLLRHQVPPAIINEITNELSSSSYSSTSSGSGDSSSHSSDTSNSTDLWHSPHHIAMCSLYPEHRAQGSPDGEASPLEVFSYRQGSPTHSEMSILDSPSYHLTSQPFFVNDVHLDSPPAHPDCQTQLMFINNPKPDSPTFNPPSPIRNTRMESPSYSGNQHQRFLSSNVPDLLIQSSPKPEVKTTVNTHRSSTRHVSEDGGILSCPGGDVVVIIPPGAVQQEHLFQVKLNTDPSVTSSIRGSSADAIISPIVEITAPGAGIFHKSIMIKLPYRALASTERHACQEDPLCSYSFSSLELRYWDKSSCAWRPTEWQKADYGVINHHTWPECFDPEPDATHSKQHKHPPHVTYSCFSSICTIQSTISGTFCLTSRRQDPNRTCCHLLGNASLNQQGNMMKMCAAVGATYHLDTVGVDGISRKSSLRQINYVVYVGDNTAGGRQQIEDTIRASGGRQQCVCIPLDLSIGSEVKVTLTSVSDPDWPWEIPFDSTYKMIPWRELCADYGTLTRVEFRCLPKNDDLLIAMPTGDDIATTFHLDAIGSAVDEASVTHAVIANSGFCDYF